MYHNITTTYLLEVDFVEYNKINNVFLYFLNGFKITIKLL